VLLFSDGTSLPVTVAGDLPWQCNLDADRIRIREQSSGGGGAGGNKAPQASVRTDLLTRNTGQPSLVLLDGSNSSDADGTIASYAFQVAVKATGEVVFNPPASATSFVTTTLAPGDYVVSLVVTDDQGAASAPGTRTLSIK